MANGIIQVPVSKNESTLHYAPASSEKNEIMAKIAFVKSTGLDIPLIIGGKEISTGNLADCRCPHNHHHLPEHSRKIIYHSRISAIRICKKNRIFFDSKHLKGGIYHVTNEWW